MSFCCFILLNKFWIKEILKMNNENDLNSDVLVASNRLIKVLEIEYNFSPDYNWQIC